MFVLCLCLLCFPFFLNGVMWLPLFVHLCSLQVFWLCFLFFCDARYRRGRGSSYGIYRRRTGLSYIAQDQGQTIPRQAILKACNYFQSACFTFWSFSKTKIYFCVALLLLLVILLSLPPIWPIAKTLVMYQAHSHNYIITTTLHFLLVPKWTHSKLLFLENKDIVKTSWKGGTLSTRDWKRNVSVVFSKKWHIT